MSEDTPVVMPEVPATPVSPPASAVAAGRYSVAEDGQVFWQEQPSNPLPGVAVGHIEKGDAMLAPKAVLSEGQTQAQEWLDIHIRSVLEPLFKLKQVEGEGALSGAAIEIGQRLYDHLGVIHRADLEDIIPALDADMRKLLRAKGVRMGPVLVFLPALVKPAAVRMRALLWALWNGKPLPIAKPADGRVSETIDPATIDRNYYRMIGYPVFGPRCIRIDMLDRVVTDIYDAAQEGVFEAKHKYAEWFGCGLDDLHAILESMGHRRYKTDGAAVEGAVATTEEAAPAVAPAPVEGVTAVVIESGDPAEIIAAVPAKAPPVVVKFMLKRGKMSDRPNAHRQHNKPQNRKPVEAAAVVMAEKADKPDKFEKKFTPKKRYDPNKSERPSREQNGRGDKPEGERSHKPKFDRNKGRDDDRNREAKVYSFEGKKKDGDDDNNPFAILKNLKN